MSECVLWDGATNKAGYGVTWHKNKWAYAHRVVVGAEPDEVVRHTCDNPSCVNPEHLIIGTAKENSEDMVRKHRQARGESCARAKLTEDQVLGIRKSHGSLSASKVASIYNISKTNVLDIWNRHTWRHI